jgi:hypothetical protein
MRRILYFGTLAAVLVGSFLLTLWYIDTTSSPDSTDTRPDRERLAERRVSDYDELAREAGAVGLRFSRRINGNIDAINRINERDVSITGWLADPEGDATPLDIIVFVAGRVAARTQTKGERPDVTRTLGLGFGAEKNVAFQVIFSCRAGDQPVVVGLGVGKRYFPLPSRRCP